MAKAKRLDAATVRTKQGTEVTLLAMDDGSLAVTAPAGTEVWSVVSLFSGAGGTRLRLMTREPSAGED
jgi:hypothetical protein